MSIINGHINSGNPIFRLVNPSLLCNPTVKTQNKCKLPLVYKDRYNDDDGRQSRGNRTSNGEAAKQWMRREKARAKGKKEGTRAHASWTTKIKKVALIWKESTCNTTKRVVFANLTWYINLQGNQISTPLHFHFFAFLQK